MPSTPEPAERRALFNRVAPCVLALPMGVAVGAVDALFGRTLLAIGAFRDDRIAVLLPLLSLAGLLIVWFYRTFGKTAARGMSLVFDVGHGRERAIPMRLVPLIMGSTWLTHLFGGSAGREGVAVQMGATISHGLGVRLGRPVDDNVMLVAGMAAGFAGLFRTPVAATLFAIEVLHAGRLEYRALIPALLGSLCASATSGALGLGKFEVDLVLPQGPDADLLMRALALGVVFGLVGAAFSWALGRAKGWAASMFESPYARVAAMGTAVAAAMLLLGGRYAASAQALSTPPWAEGRSCRSIGWRSCCSPSRRWRRAIRAGR